MSLRFAEAEAAAPRLGLSLTPLPIRKRSDLDGVVETIASDRPDGVFMVSDSVTQLGESALIEFMRANRIPSMFEFPPAARKGGLMSYGPSVEEMAPRAAAFVDKILKGAKASDLPLEAPVRWLLVLNLRAAQQIGLALPAPFVARADEVIE